MALPLIRVLRNARPDAEFTLLCRPEFQPLLELLKIGDLIKPLPNKGTPSYYLKVLQWDEQYPDLHILFTNSLRGDLESYLIGAPQRFGLELPRKPRCLLTHTYKPTKEIIKQIKTTHQTKLWEKMLRHFGLTTEITANPYSLSNFKRRSNKFGFIPGSSNNSSKCWAPQNWIELGNRILKVSPSSEIHLYGTRADRKATDIIAKGLPRNKVKNRGGETDLEGLAKELATCVLIVGNDTGGIHLANALGTPVVVLYGPTNPIVTGPLFNSPKACMQPKGCSPAGGTSMEALSVESVLNGIKSLIVI
jgi:ADP-heptose:LPS heptosyltransferase